MLVMLQTDRYWPDFCRRIGVASWCSIRATAT